MHDEGLLGIGAFALLGGVTVGALRHYEEVGILGPAWVDPATRYRYYRPEQVAEARLVRALRAVELPLGDIRLILEERDPASTHTVLVAHKERLSAQAELLSGQLAALNELIERGVEMPATRGNRIVMINVPVIDLAPSRRFYEALLDVEFAEEAHGDEAVHLNATFGEWNTPSWFLLSLWPDRTRAGTADLGFFVEDLDRAFERALADGATAVEPPHDADGMPRNAQVEDPSGNHVGLYQS